MAFHIKRRRPIDRELQRLARNEFETALEELNQTEPDDDAIHEARKCVKKLRSLLRLVEPALDDFSEQNEQLRAAGHELAALRDVDASAETVAMLRGRYPTVITKRLATELVDELQRRGRHIDARAPRMVTRAADILENARKRVLEGIKDAARLDVLRKGATKSYRRARKAMENLTVEADAAQFHLLRRRVKNHWYQMRILESVHRTPHERARNLKHLDTCLGDDHNLALLRTTLLANPPQDQTAEANAVVLGCIAKRQASLRTRALKISHRLFHRPPRKFKRSVALWCRNAHQAAAPRA
jgi:CHAD domain-containing protein